MSQEPGSSNLPFIDRPFKPEDDVHSEDVAITSDNMSFTNENPLSTRLRLENTDIYIAEAASGLRPSYTDDLESIAITSDDMSIHNEYPLASRVRRQNKAVPIAQAAAILRPSRAEELDESVAVTSDEEMSMTGHPHSLSKRLRRHDDHHPVAPAANLLPDPPRGRRLLRERSPRVSPHSPVHQSLPSPASRPALASRHDIPPSRGPSLIPGPAARGGPAPRSGPASRSVPIPTASTDIMDVSSVEYGYGYGGHEPGNFFLTEDIDESEPDISPTRSRRQRFMYFNTFARQGDMDIVTRQNAMLAGWEQSLELFPGVETDEGFGFDIHGEVEMNEPKDEDETEG
ncbi:hypothetical protein N7451_000582 [Penicillium sp. IBT 35674x]|nr:hypothetical protein N7451_000582 [Penicillium sp. IBT 35674x]